jgi:mono/diheme cytochrome c family protein
VSWGLNRVDEVQPLLKQLLHAKDYRARAAAVRVLRYSGHQIPDHLALLRTAAADGHGRVRMEAFVAASWLGKSAGLSVLEVASKPRDPKAVVTKPAEATLDEKGVLHVAGGSLNTTPVDTITISLPGPNQTLNLAEVEIISGGRNIAAQARISQSSRYDDTLLVPLLIDGNLDTFAHSKENDKNPRFVFKFPRPVIIDEVKIFNRKGYEQRFEDGQVTFAAAGKKLLTMRVNLNSTVSVAGMDSWLAPVYKTARAYLQGQVIEADAAPVYTTHLTGKEKEIFLRGAEVFNREGHCITCHQSDGKGLPAAQFPPLAGSEWVTGPEERLIKLTLHGLYGPIEVKGEKFPGVVPMTPFKMLSDQEVAAVLSFVRNTFGNKASMVKPESVKKVRAATQAQDSFYTPAELRKAYPE